MRHHVHAGLLAVVLLIAGQLAAQTEPDAPPDPQTHGPNAAVKITEHEDAKALKEWLTQLASDLPEDHRKAIESLAKPQVIVIGPDLQTPDRVAFQRDAKPLVGKLTELLEHPNENVVCESLRWLSAIGSEAQGCVPVLKARILDPSTTAHLSAIYTLLDVVPEDTPIGPVILESLSIYLKSLTRKELRELEIHLETETQTDGTTTDRLSGSGALGLGIVATGYAIALAESGHTLSEVPYLLKAASPDYPNYIRAVALGILAELSEECKAAIPRLRELLHDNDPVVRYLAANALLYISGKPETITELADQLGFQGRKRQQFERSAGQRLAKVAETWDSAEAWRDPEIRQYVLLQIEYGNGFYRRQGLRLLRQWGPDAEQAKPLLRRLLTHADEETRRLAAEMLQRIAGT